LRRDDSYSLAEKRGGTELHKRVTQSSASTLAGGRAALGHGLPMILALQECTPCLGGWFSALAPTRPLPRLISMQARRRPGTYGPSAGAFEINAREAARSANAALPAVAVPALTERCRAPRSTTGTSWPAVIFFVGIHDGGDDGVHVVRHAPKNGPKSVP